MSHELWKVWKTPIQLAFPTPPTAPTDHHEVCFEKLSSMSPVCVLDVVGTFTRYRAAVRTRRPLPSVLTARVADRCGKGSHCGCTGSA